MNRMIRTWRMGLAASAFAALAACGGGGGGGGLGDAGGGGSSGAPGRDPQSAPAPVIEFAAVGSSGRTASLRWTPLAGASGYRIERATASGSFVPVATLAGDAESFVDEGLTPETEYRYRLAPVGVGTTAADRVAKTTGDVPMTTSVGAVQGSAAVQTTLGAAGGSLGSVDGRARVSVPSGAVTAGTTASLHAITNTAPGGQGGGVRLRMDSTPAAPLTLTMGYAAEIDALADGLGIAIQRRDGSWFSAPVTAIDKTARTLTAQLPPSLLTGSGVAAAQGAVGSERKQAQAATGAVTLEVDVVTYLDFYLLPRSASVKTGATQLLVPHARTVLATGRWCQPEEGQGGCLWLPLLETREVPFQNAKDGYTRRWYVFAEEGGTTATGTISPRGEIGAIYKAPVELPPVNPVIVSFRSIHDRSGRTLTLSASLRISEPVWTGIASGTLSAPGGDLAFRFGLQSVWTPAPGSGATRFAADGTQQVSVIPGTCGGTATPDTVPVPPGALTIDRSVSPARYTLDFGSRWPTTLHGVCPEGSVSVPMDVPSRLVVEGVVGGNGTRIEGTATLNGVTWSWALTSELP